MKRTTPVAIAMSAALALSAVATSFATEIQAAELPVLQNTVTTDTSGTASLPSSGLIDFIFPSHINGTDVTAIGDHAFYGCDLFRTVTIPANITYIGSNAFSDCPHLETIILAGRIDSSDMVLGDNWSGSAQILYEFEIVEPEAENKEDEKENNADGSESSGSSETSGDEDAAGANASEEGSVPSDEAGDLSQSEPPSEPVVPGDRSDALSTPIVEDVVTPQQDPTTESSDSELSEPDSDALAEPAAASEPTSEPATESTKPSEPGTTADR